MSEQATEPGVVEEGHPHKSLKGQRMIMVSFGGAIDAGLLVGGCQFRPHRRHVMGDSVPKRLASLSPVEPNSLGVWQS
jgi:hypothetical protein